MKMNTKEERAAKIAEISEFPDKVVAAVKGLSDSQLDTPYREGGWTVRQLVHHLADAHMHGYLRMRFLLTEDNFRIQPYDQDAWADLPDARAAGLTSSLELLKGLHMRWAALLSDLPDETWGRRGYHPDSGEVTLDSLLDLYSGHGKHHVHQILKLRKERGW